MSRVAAILAASGCWYFDPLENFKRWERRTTASKGGRLELVFDEIRQARRGFGLHSGEECLHMRVDELVQRRLYRPPPVRSGLDSR